MAVWLGVGASAAVAAVVEGSIRLEGDPPAPRPLVIEPKRGAHSTEGCEHLSKVSPQLLVSPEGGVANAVVWLEASPDASQGERDLSVVLDQKGCEFVPHVAIVPPGGKLLIRNSDPILHNVRIFKEAVPSMLMHRWHKRDASDISWSFKEPGRYVVRCGIHPWMYAWVVVANHRSYAVSDSEGHFTLPVVPPGRHTLTVWHETLGSATVPINVESEETRLKPILMRQKVG